jgi:predicted RNA-binding Zn ribbon-like protein
MQTLRKTFRGLPLVAGHLVLDFVNTVEYRGRKEPLDRLTGFSDLIEWCSVAGLLSRNEKIVLSRPAVERSQEAASAFRNARALREHLRILLDPKRRKTRAFERSLAALQSFEDKLRLRIRYDRKPGTFCLDVPVSTPKDVVSRLLDRAGRFLVDSQKLRVRQCNGPNCDWLFMDTSKAGRRRWCQPETCGNMMRVRRFRERQENRFRKDNGRSVPN